MTQTEKDMQELNMTPAKLAARQEQLAGITGAPRKTRSDAGKPREKKAADGYELWIKIPGVHCDVASPVGRRALSDHVASGATEFSGIGWEIIEQLLKEIDRLRAK